MAFGGEYAGGLDFESGMRRGWCWLLGFEMLCNYFKSNKCVQSSFLNRSVHTFAYICNSLNGKQGPASNLKIGEVPTPEPGPTQLLVRVHSFALNRMDILQREGRYPPPAGASAILGVEFSGTVVAMGPLVTRFAVGDAVFGLVSGGAYAEYCVIEAAMAVRKPEGVSFGAAAALPEVWMTAYQALFVNCALKAGEDVLIHAGASGVGIAAIQLAKRAGARHIIVTAGSDAKTEFCLSIGATHAINYKNTDFAAAVAEVTGSKGVNVLVDFVGASYWARNLASLGMDGRMVMLGFLGGPVVPEGVNLGPILQKRLTVRGSTLRSRSLEYQIELKEKVEADVFGPMFANGTNLRWFIDTEFSWNNIQDAHVYLESDQSKGKIVVHVD
ncbi:hypothetical protein HDU84_008329 [Entophlyctis sp. JEL0112]|nr:hypothetical protein HDU84_008329 [Entophlyctis sp. JEL0112]